jgi:hypothetical protein
VNVLSIVFLTRCTNLRFGKHHSVHSTRYGRGIRCSAFFVLVLRGLLPLSPPRSLTLPNDSLPRSPSSRSLHSHVEIPISHLLI